MPSTSSTKVNNISINHTTDPVTMASSPTKPILVVVSEQKQQKQHHHQNLGQSATIEDAGRDASSSSSSSPRHQHQHQSVSTKNGISVLTQFIASAFDERIKDSTESTSPNRHQLLKNFNFIIESLREPVISNSPPSSTTNYSQQRVPAHRSILSADKIMIQRKRWLLALNQCISYFGSRRLIAVVDAVISMDLLAVDALIVKPYLGFIENLVSAHPSLYITTVLTKLVKTLRQSSSSTISTAINMTTVMPNNMPVALDLEQRIHSSFHSIFQMVPSAVTAIIPILSSMFPHKREQRDLIGNYTKHLIRLCRHTPLIASQIIEIIVDRLLKMDVEVTVDMDELDGEELALLASTADSSSNSSNSINSSSSSSSSNSGNSINNSINNSSGPIIGEHNENDEDDSDDDDDDDDEDEDGYGDYAVETRSEALKRIQETLGKIESVIDPLMDYFTSIARHANDGSTATPSTKPPLKSLNYIYITMLGLFDRLILRTHMSKYTQFLLFHLSSLHPAFPESLISLLITRIFDQSLAANLRCTAASYLASYLARSKFLQRSIICHSLKLCAEWLHVYLDTSTAVTTTNTAATTGVDIHRHAVFYCVFQAVLYVFCYRWRELIYGSTMAIVTMEHEETLLASSTSLPPASSSAGAEVMAAATAARKRKISLTINTCSYTNFNDDDDCGSTDGVCSPYMEWWRVRGGFQRLLLSKLNPLRVCAQSVVEEFDRLSVDLQLTYCNSILNSPSNPATPSTSPNNPQKSLMDMDMTRLEEIERQQQQQQSLFASGSRSIELSLEALIESFFPFDPFHRHLGSSIQQRIDPLYMEWSGDNDRDDDDDHDDGGVEKQDGNEIICTSNGCYDTNYKKKSDDHDAVMSDSSDSDSEEIMQGRSAFEILRDLVAEQ